MIKIKMIQTSKYVWKIESDKGILLKDGILVNNEYEANEYAKKYASSFHGWTVELQPLTQKETK